MSLINDALRKARQAASEHEAERAGSGGGLRPAYPGRGRPRSIGPVVVLVAVTAAVAGAAGSWWLAGRQDRNGEQTLGAAPAATAAAPTPAPTEAVARAGGVADERALPTRAPEPVPATSAGGSRPVPGGAPVERATALPTAAAGTGERVYILDAEVGGRTLSLGFIVARSESPFAEINGREVGIGSKVEGFTVEAIEADRVVLRDADGPLVLRVP